eukprot:TRINITY_DN2701_c0_g2_i3.p1 TRINITY_DN2701_c0_g2~~TRINITY_DN2701_c0_g2_i3.p1  ORF type:complete len:441 (-),score=31.61 TRINITY_DN2701_c0_g2_i3:1036-2277(-)
MSYSLPISASKFPFSEERFGGGLWGAQQLLQAKGRINENRLLRQTCQLVCTGQVLYGLVSALTCFFFLYSFVRFSGVLISLLLIVVGLLGLIGSVRGNRALLNAHIFTVMLAMMLAYDFSAQVNRDTQVDCAIAELYSKQQVLQQVLQETQKQELINQIFVRINEMEDMIQMSHESAVMAMTVRDEQQGLKLTDENYIKAKTQMLKDHANKLVDDLMNNPIVTNEWVQNLNEEQMSVLNKRMDAAEQVLDKIARIEDEASGESMSYEEYGRLLNVLMEAFQSPLHFEETVGNLDDLQQANLELPNMNAAMQRQEQDKYHQIVLPSEAQKYLQERQAALEERRHKWQRRFLDELQKHRDAHDRSHDSLADMPEHCLMEEGAKSILSYSSVAIIAMQLVSGACVMTLLFALPKRE